MKKNNKSFYFVLIIILIFPIFFISCSGGSGGGNGTMLGAGGNNPPPPTISPTPSPTISPSPTPNPSPSPTPTPSPAPSPSPTPLPTPSEFYSYLLTTDIPAGSKDCKCIENYEIAVIINNVIYRYNVIDLMQIGIITNNNFNNITAITYFNGKVFILDKGTNSLWSYDYNINTNTWSNPQNIATLTNPQNTNANMTFVSIIRTDGYVEIRDSAGIQQGFSPWQSGIANPKNIAIDTTNVYVLYNHAVNKYAITSNTLLLTFGSFGSGFGQFNTPLDIYYANNRIYIADTGNCRFQVFDQNGNFLTAMGSQGYANDQFQHPISITADENLNIYVLDPILNQLKKFKKL